MKTKGYYIYKYVYNDEIIYIGKTNVCLVNRIDCHAREEKFKNYLDDCQIFYFECKNSAETTIMECYLINKYKPILNVSMKYSDNLNIDIPEPEWVCYKRNDFIQLNSNIKKKYIPKLISSENIDKYPSLKETYESEEYQKWFKLINEGGKSWRKYIPEAIKRIVNKNGVIMNEQRRNIKRVR